MKKSLFVILLFVSFISRAQVTAITPNQGTAGYSVSTTITSSGLFLSSSSPQGNIQDIILRNAADSTYADADSTQVIDANTAKAVWNIPANLATGVYNLVIRIADLVSHAISEFSLSNAFTVNSPAATVSGVVYKDLNSNGNKDSGEPGLPGYRVQLSTGGTFGISDALGNYTIAATVGSNVVSIQQIADDTLENSGAISYPVTVVSGSNPNYNFGLKLSRSLTSISPNTASVGQTKVVNILATKAFKNGIIYNAVLKNGSSLFSGNNFSVTDSNHAVATFNIPSGTSVGKYGLSVLVKSTVNNQIRSYYLDTVFNVTGPHGLISGYAYLDSNHNNIFDAGDRPLPNKVVNCFGSSYFSKSTDSNGYYEFHTLPAGSYTLYINGQSCGGAPLFSPASRNVTVNEDTAVSQNFSTTNVSSYDLYIHPGWQWANPGFFRQFWIYYGSYSNYQGNVTVTMNYDPKMILDSTSIPNATHDVANHTLTWVQPFQSWNYFIRPRFKIPLTVASGDILHNVFHIAPDSADCDLSNNTVYDNTPVTSSMDPNEKIAFPADTMVPKMDSVLFYTINCQNTGTAPTHFVVIKDTLSANLDPKTVEFTGSSHPCVFTNENGILTFTMDPVQLIDSATDEKNSHGSVSFSVRLKSGLPIGTVVKNKAFIYFDYNPAVVTNETKNTVAKKVSIGIDETTSKFNVNVFPNPFTESTTVSFSNAEHHKVEVSLMNNSGQTIRYVSTTGNEVVWYKNELPSGVYFYRIYDPATKRSKQGKLVIL